MGYMVRCTLALRIMKIRKMNGGKNDENQGKESRIQSHHQYLREITGCVEFLGQTLHGFTH